MISKMNAEHYIWGDRCDGWRLVNHADRTIIHEKMPPGTSEARHYHNKAAQFFFIISGVMIIEIDGTDHQLQPHEGIEVPPLAAHQVFNKSAHDLEFLVISTPSTRNDRVNI
jgi:mannose-6-phosphate isomerase-like protein (cupin superfamily)